jgi:hypothetical protein
MRSSPSRVVALVLGAAFLLVGALGFTADAEAWLFGILSVNTVQNVLHLVIGAVLIAVAFSSRAPLLTAILGTVLLALGIAGLFIINTEFNIIAVNGAANLLHFASAAVLLGVGLGARR